MNWDAVNMVINMIIISRTMISLRGLSGNIIDIKVKLKTALMQTIVTVPQ